VRYAPSALLAGIALGRSRRRIRGSPSLLGLGDPTANLRAAVPEVRSIGKLFPLKQVHIAEREAATAAVLTQCMAGRSHVHLACHGRGGLISVEDAAIELADRPITALELTALPDVAARSCVISACQTAVAEFNEQPDEAISVSTALLAARSACVIASLWSVDDAATAILMTRLYEEMLVSDERPPEALRKAQLWLRDLTPEDEEHFLASHPELEQEWRRRMEAGEPVGRRGTGPIDAERPYHHPDLWAPFIATGAY
jgi:CHAT domain-containing protein